MSASTEVGCIQRGSAQSYRALDDRDISLDVLCTLGGVLDLLEYLTHRGLLQHLANERNSGGNVWLYYIPWYLVLPSSIYGLQLVACFSKVCGMLIYVFRPVVYLHHDSINAFSTR